MAKFIVNKIGRGELWELYEIHNITTGCSYLPEQENRIELGDFISCRSALITARQIYPSADGCYYCCNGCHTG